jgi:hypothetical protein
MTTSRKVCDECLTVQPVDEHSVCEACERDLAIAAAYDKGWRTGWQAASKFIREDGRRS